MKSCKVFLLTLLFVVLMSGCNTMRVLTVQSPVYPEQVSPEPDKRLERSRTGAVLWQQTGNNDLISTVSGSVVAIKTITPTDTLIEHENISSGIILPGGLVVTTAHGLDMAGKIFINHAASEYSGKIVDLDIGYDLALIKLNRDQALAYSIPEIRFNLRPTLGMQVFCAGYPVIEGVEDTQPAITSGVVSVLQRSLRRSNGQLHTGLIQIDAVATEGNSGGPVFDQEGRILGLTGYTITTRNIWSGATFVIPAEQIVDFMNRNKIQVK